MVRRPIRSPSFTQWWPGSQRSPSWVWETSRTQGLSLAQAPGEWGADLTFVLIGKVQLFQAWCWFYGPSWINTCFGEGYGCLAFFHSSSFSVSVVDRSSRSNGPSGTRGSDLHRSHTDERGRRDRHRGSERRHDPGLVTHPGTRRVGSGPDLRPRREVPALPSMVLVLWTFRDQHVLQGRLRMSGLLPLIIILSPSLVLILRTIQDQHMLWGRLWMSGLLTLSILCYGRPQVLAWATSS